MPKPVPPTKPLTPEQKALCEAFAKQYPKVVALLITKHPGTYRWARAFGLDHDEIQQLGWVGVLHAAKKFVPGTVSKGRVVAFVTYALPWIRQAVCRPMIDAGRQRRSPQSGRVVSGTANLGARGFRILFDGTPDTQTPGPFEALDRQETRERLAQALLRLPSRDRRIVARRFGYSKANGRGETLDAIAKDVGLTKERVRQIEKESVERILLDLVTGQ